MVPAPRPTQLLLVTTLSLVACTGVFDKEPQAATTMTDHEIRVAANTRVCDNAADEVQCHARVLVDAFGQIRPNTTPAGFGPPTLQPFYGITSNVSLSHLMAGDS